ncbi:hypothetical protein [Microcoleus sp. bin38.metabat.b11b12b14.051]|uniref:hypothetical protein n=1 Tax=Microcoleus sp. bin38.metabat.b11b12b14.051 TaxID=2742709 RepID=UPI0025FB11AB|nr:hypothetical protein [Microcoleus sp. bin38.metabat.b11b12b14.051]
MGVFLYRQKCNVDATNTSEASALRLITPGCIPAALAAIELELLSNFTSSKQVRQTKENSNKKKLDKPGVLCVNRRRKAKNHTGM